MHQIKHSVIFTIFTFLNSVLILTRIFYSRMEDGLCPFSDISEMGIFDAMEIIFNNLRYIDQINLAATSKTLRSAAFESSKVVKSVTMGREFNFDLFPSFITNREVFTIHCVFPDLEKIRANLRFFQSNPFKELRVFKKLEKLTIYIPERRDSYPIDYRLKIKSLCIRQNFYILHQEAVFNFIRNLDGLENFAIYDGKLTRNAIEHLDTYNLKKIKIHNTEICNQAQLLHNLIEKGNRNLEVLRLTYTHYSMSCANLIFDLFDLLDHYEMKLRKFTFTLNWYRGFKIENLLKLRHLKELIIYFHTRIPGTALVTIYQLAEQMPNTEITLEEYEEIPYCQNEDDYERIVYKSIHLRLNYGQNYSHIKNIKFKAFEYKGYAYME